MYRGVLQEKDIVSCRDGLVTFRYRDSQSGQMQRRSLPGAQFLRLLLQHVLPKGFRRARNYGFLHPNSKRLQILLRLLFSKAIPEAIAAWIKPKPTLACKGCGQAMRIVRTRSSPPIGDIQSALQNAYNPHEHWVFRVSTDGKFP